MTIQETKSLCKILVEEFGFQVESQADLPEKSDNFTIVLDSAAFRVRYINDKSGSNMEMASIAAPNEWHPVSLVYMLVNDQPPPDGVASPAAMTEFVKKTYSTLKELFRPDRYKATKKGMSELAKADPKSRP
jgi:hypothetical protein